MAPPRGGVLGLGAGKGCADRNHQLRRCDEEEIVYGPVEAHLG